MTASGGDDGPTPEPAGLPRIDVVDVRTWQPATVVVVALLGLLQIVTGISQWRGGDPAMRGAATGNLWFGLAFAAVAAVIGWAVSRPRLCATAAGLTARPVIGGRRILAYQDVSRISREAVFEGRRQVDHIRIWGRGAKPFAEVAASARGCDKLLERLALLRPDLG